MRNLKTGVENQLLGGASTFCRCWLIERRDGVALGFTDHDQPIAFEGWDFRPETGFTRSELQSSLGLSVDNMEALGALRSDAITEEDIARGRYDGATITQWLVDWREVNRREKVFSGTVGEIRRGAQAFQVEFTGLSEALNRPMGRVFLRKCDAEVGDARCKVSLTGGFRQVGAIVSAIDERRFVVSGFADEAAFPADWFSLGKLEWSSGGNLGETVAVRRFLRQSGGAVVDLWRAPSAPVANGDGFVLSAGCDKSAETCQAKFANFDNFRGFPHMPGEDWAASYPTSEDSHDGGSLFQP